MKTKATHGTETVHFTRESEAEEAWQRWTPPAGCRVVENSMEYNKDGTFTVVRKWAPAVYFSVALGRNVTIPE